MKKAESTRHIKPPILESNSYYKEIGEQAAIQTFTRNKFRHKLKSISPSSQIKSTSKDDLIKADRPFMKPLRSPLARDISHIRDKLASPVLRDNEIALQKCISLPFDINTVKNLLKSSDIYGNPFNQGEPISTSCRREACLNNVYKSRDDLPEIDKMFLGSPTGKQECDLLIKWVSTMKGNYCGNENSTENINAIYTMASREIIRQISVHYYERGELLREIIDYYIKRYENIKENIDMVYKNTSKIKEALLNDFKEKEKGNLFKLEKIEETMGILNFRLQQKNRIIDELNQQVVEITEKLEEFQSKYSIKEENSFRGYNPYNRRNSILSRKKSPYNSPLLDTFHNALPSPLSFYEKSVQTIIDLTYYPNLDEDELIKLSKNTQTNEKQLSIYQNGFGIEIVGQTSLKPLVPCAIINENNDSIKKDEGIQVLSQDNDINQELHRIDTIDEEKLKNIGIGIEPIEPEGLIYQDISDKRLSVNNDIFNVVIQNMKNSLKRNSQIMNKNTRQLKTTKTQNLDFNKNVAENERKIEELSKIIEEQSITIDILKGSDESRRQSFIPTITINQVPEDERNQNFDLLSYQSGYQVGFNSGYELGINTIAENSQMNPANTSNFWNEDDESDTDSPEKLNNSKERLRKLTSNSTINSPVLLKSNTVAQNSELINDDHSFLSNYDEERSEGEESRYIDDHQNKTEGKSHFFRSFQPKKTLVGLTEVIGFLFHKKIFKQTKSTFPERLLDRILNKNITAIKARATMGKKMLNKLMANMYLSYFLRNDFTEPLLHFIYNEFLQKSGLKRAGDKKFVSFISSMIIAQDSRRARVFLKFINAGKAIKESNYSHFTLKFYLECLNFMITSKIGISIIDDTLDKVMLPLIRGIECIKENLENIDRNAINKTISLIENNSSSDPKKINSTGLIENEFLLETLANIYEAHQKSIVEGVELIINCIKYNEDKSFIYKNEAVIAVRIIYPLKLDYVIASFSEETIRIEDFCLFCIEKSIFSINEISTFYADENKTDEETVEIIENGVFELLLLLNDIKNQDKFLKSLSYDTWIGKLNLLKEGVYSRNSYESLLAFSIYKNELLKLKLTI